jgi:hypothetical protein
MPITELCQRMFAASTEDRHRCSERASLSLRSSGIAGKTFLPSMMQPICPRAESLISPGIFRLSMRQKPCRTLQTRPQKPFMTDRPGTREGLQLSFRRQVGAVHFSGQQRRNRSKARGLRSARNQQRGKKSIPNLEIAESRDTKFRPGI